MEFSPKEPPVFETGRWETQESEPTHKHEVVIEQELSAAGGARSEWLAGVWHANGYNDQMNQNRMLEDWKLNLPGQEVITNDLYRSHNSTYGRGNNRDLSETVRGAIYDGDFGQVKKIQSLCKAVLEYYGSAEGSKGWNSLPEINKKYVRMAEMTIMYIDADKLQRDINDGKVKPTSADRLVSKLQRYSESSDIPQNFKAKVIDPVLKQFNKKEQKVHNRQNLNPRQDRPIRETSTRFRPMDVERERQDSVTNADDSQETQIESTDASPDALAEDGTIETEFNSETGSFEPVGEEHSSPEVTPDQPPRLTYEPGTVSPSGNDGSPPPAVSGPEAIPSPPAGGGGVAGG